MWEKSTQNVGTTIPNSINLTRCMLEANQCKACTRVNTIVSQCSGRRHVSTAEQYQCSSILQEPHWAHFVALISGLPTVQFWLLAVCKNGGGRHGNILSCERRQCLGSQSTRPYLVVFVPSAGVPNVREVKNSTAPGSNEERMCEMHSFWSETPPASVY